MNGRLFGEQTVFGGKAAVAIEDRLELRGFQDDRRHRGRGDRQAGNRRTAAEERIVSFRMAGIHPWDIRCVWRGDIEVDDDGILAAAHHYYFDGLVGAGVQLLVRDEGRDENEIAGSGFIGELQAVAPAHSGAATDDVEDALQLAVVMRAGLGVGLNHYGAGPELAGAGAGVIDGGGAGHAGGLGRVGVEFAGTDDADAVCFPVGGHEF